MIIHFYYFVIIYISINAILCLQSFSVTYTERYHPNQDLMSKILETAKDHKFKAANLQNCVGSVKYCWIRTANQDTFKLFNDGPYEIVSLVGTVDHNQKPHIHIAISDKFGKTFGGHLPSLDERNDYFKDIKQDCLIYTTAEIIYNENLDLIYKRQYDPETTYDELVVIRKEHNSFDKVKTIIENVELQKQ